MAAATSKVWRKAPFSPPHLRTQQEALLAAWQNKYFLLAKSITLVLPLRRANEDSLCTDPPTLPSEKIGEGGPLSDFFRGERGSVHRLKWRLPYEYVSASQWGCEWDCVGAMSNCTMGMFLRKYRNRTIAWWRNFATTTRILEIVVFFYKLGILVFKTSSWLTNLNKKAKTKWILVVVVKCRHHEIWTIANYKMIMPPKNPTDQFETTPTQ